MLHYGSDGVACGQVYHPVIDLRGNRMFYQRSMDIESRLHSVLELIRRGDYSTPKIATTLGVSIPTVSRDVTALRERGHDIRSLRSGLGWQFVLTSKKPPTMALRDNAKFKPVRASRAVSNFRTESA